MTYLSLLLLAETCIYIRDFGVLKIDIALLLILKSKLSVKSLSNLDKKDAITTLKTKNNNGVLILRPKKMLLLDDFIPAITLVTCKKPWS